MVAAMLVLLFIFRAFAPNCLCDMIALPAFLRPELLFVWFLLIFGAKIGAVSSTPQIVRDAGSAHYSREEKHNN